jgi:hypothetical protein
VLHFVVMNFEMAELDKWRNRAISLFAMVIHAREQGLGSADHLADLANEALARADEIDRLRLVITPGNY